MLTVTRKLTLGQLGAFCLIVSGMTVMSCQSESIAPQTQLTKGYVVPGHVQADSVKVNDDQPPKDVGSGSGAGTSASAPTDSVRTNDDQPPKDVGSGSGT